MPAAVSTFMPIELHTSGVVDRYLTFEYLPRTAANLALADIRAQHPDATVVEPEIPGDE